MSCRNLIASALLLMLFSGCATTKQPFAYDHPVKSRIAKSSKLTVAVLPVKDRRRAGREINAVYQTHPLRTVQTIIQEELASTGYFDKVSVARKKETAKATIIVEPSMTKLNWEVPNYKSKVTRIGIISMCTGGIGGLIYGSTPTDVYGDTALHLRFIDAASGTVLLENTYSNHYIERMAKLSCDLPKNKVRIIGASLKKTMGSVKSDARKVAEQAKQKATTRSAGEPKEPLSENAVIK